MARPQSIISTHRQPQLGRSCSDQRSQRLSLTGSSHHSHIDAVPWHDGGHTATTPWYIYIYMCVCVCVCYWPPVREVCPNYDAVMFQPRTVTPPQLGSVAIVTPLNWPYLPTCFYRFLEHSFPYSFLPPIHTQLFTTKPLSQFVPDPYFLSRRKAPPTWMLSATANCQPLPLVPAPLTTCLRLPSFYMNVHPPLS